jgi:hypothetical protein
MATFVDDPQRVARQRGRNLPARVLQIRAVPRAREPDEASIRAVDIERKRTISRLAS